MLLFKDVFTGHDIFTDAYKTTLVDDLYFIVEGKFIKDDRSIDDCLIGGNKSAEDETAADAEEVVLVSNIVHGCKLEQIPSIGTKAEFKDAIKAYMLKLVKHVDSNDKERGVFLKSKLNDIVKLLLGKFKKLQWYASEDDGFELEGMIIPYEQDDELGLEKLGCKCQIIVFKDGVIQEKC